MKNKILVTFMALCLVGTTPIAAQSKEASENNEVSDTYGHHEIADSLEQPAPGSNDYLRKTTRVSVTNCISNNFVLNGRKVVSTIL